MASWQSRLTALFLRLAVKRPLDPYADPAVMRARVNRMAGRLNAKAPWIRTSPVSANGVPGEWIYGPSIDAVPDGATPQRSRKILLYLHGGGYVVCSPATHRLMVARMCREAGFDALLIDYRLAPEHPFPAAVEDAEAAYRWLLASGYAASDIVVAGDSAGGGLTLSLLLTLREAGMPLPAGAALLSPWTDLALTGLTMLTKAKADPMLRLDSAALATRHYLQATSPTHPIASPLHACLDGLPPLLVQVGSEEILLDDSRRLVAKALDAGVDASLEIWPGMMHVFQAFPKMPESGHAITRIGRFLKMRADAANNSAPTSLAAPVSEAAE
jgi:acetyl esterase/lipase